MNYLKSLITTTNNNTLKQFIRIIAFYRLCTTVFSVNLRSSPSFSSSYAKMLHPHIQSEGQKLVSYLSDLEGNYVYWNRFIQISEVLERLPNGELALKNPIYHFIHGGDVCDRSKGDQRILSELIQLKRKYPNNIHFLLGNRDVNKLRLPIALHPTVLKFRPHAYWVNDNTVEEGFPLNDRVAKLKWVLKQTMGAPFAFECHREELQDLHLPSTDADVTQSFLDLLQDGGDLLEYLSHGKMSVIVDDTIYVHGGLTKFGLGFVPPRYDYATKTFTEFTYDHKNLSPKQWSQQINQFAYHEISEYRVHIRDFLSRLTHLGESDSLTLEELKEHLWDSVGGYRHPQPGSRLIQCGMGMLPKETGQSGGLPPNPSIIYNGYLANGKPVNIDPEVAQWLKRDGINKIVVGHQPNGDTPFTIDELEIQAISADISYSKFVQWPQEDLIRSAEARGIDITKITRTSDEFMDYNKFKTAVLGIPNPPNPPASVQADTRNELVLNELLQIVDLTTVKLSASTSNLTPVLSKIRMHGTTGCGATYSFELPHSYENSLIGKKQPYDDWWVKAINVRLPNRLEEEYYLLSFSEGFTFRNRLIRSSDYQNRLLSLQQQHEEKEKENQKEKEEDQKN